MLPRRLALILLLLACMSGFGQQGPASVAALQDKSPAAVSSPALAVPDLITGEDGKLSQEQMRQLLRVAIDNYVENEKRQRNYTYIDREVENNLDGKGKTKSTEVSTYEVLEIYGEQVQRLIEKDDKPLDAKAASKEEEKIQKVIDKYKNESDEDRRKRKEKEAKERADNRKFVGDVADAYDFKMIGTEQVGGREAWEIEGEPRPGFEGHMKESEFLSKVRGRVWIDKGDLQISRIDIEAIDTLSFGWVLARVHKGTRVMLEQTRVNDEVWLPRHITFKFDARIALFKSYNVDGDWEYRDYKKFRTSAKIVGMDEVKEQK